MKQNTHLLAQVAISAGRGASSSSPSAAPARAEGAARVRAGPPARRVSAQPLVARVELEVDRVAQRRAPLMARMRSPGRRPAAAAGVRGAHRGHHHALRRLSATGPPPRHGQTSPARRRWAALRNRMPCTRYCSPEITVNAAASQSERRRDARAQDLEVDARAWPPSTVRIWKNGGHLAGPRRRADARVPPDHVDDQRAEREDHVAAHHDRGDPERDHLEPGQGHERRGEQELVGDRIEEGAEPRSGCRWLRAT